MITLRSYLGLAQPSHVDHQADEPVSQGDYSTTRISYAGLERDAIPAILLTPNHVQVRGGVVVFHQHNGEFHLGKSEVAGDAGDPYQAFGPALAKRGIAVLAPDAITFEDRRAQTDGVIPHENDWLQHYNALTYRLVNGDFLMRKCLDDAQRALSVLTEITNDSYGRLGVAGHSYGGLLAMYLAAVDSRCDFAAISGAVCSFEKRMREGTGINMFEVVPGIVEQIETKDLLESIGPRPTLIVSGKEDPYSKDADRVVEGVSETEITHVREPGGHVLDQHRHRCIVDWIVNQAVSTT